jgi:tRNA(Ile)-lysidine synthase
MAARKLRHDFFARTANDRNLRVIALAHHVGDQVELFFLRVLRGAGGEGLAGMKWRVPSPADAGITLVRPLLDTTKAELRQFARENTIRFREDATNASLDLPRNRIRNELLPLLQRRYQPALTKTVLRLMAIVGAEADVVGEIAKRWLAEQGRDAALRRPRTAQRAVPTYDSLPPAIQRRVLQLQLSAAGVAADFELIEQLRQSPGRPVSVNTMLSVQRDVSGTVKLQTRLPAEFNLDELTMNLASRAGEATFDDVRVCWKIEPIKKFKRPAARLACESFDADKVGGRITLRHWRPGDRFQPIGLKAAVKLQDLFTNAKISRARRRELLVAGAANGEIFWVEALRMAEHFKLTPQTKRCLVWRWRQLASGA